MAKRQNKEYKLHKAICDYIRLQYPKAIFNSDLSGQNASIAARGMAKMLRSSRSIPDLIIYEGKGSYHGLFLEIKTSCPYRLDGKLKSGDHLREQEDMLNKLRDRDYRAHFVWELDQAIDIINEYMKQ